MAQAAYAMAQLSLKTFREYYDQRGIANDHRAWRRLGIAMRFAGLSRGDPFYERWMDLSIGAPPFEGVADLAYEFIETLPASVFKTDSALRAAALKLLAGRTTA